MVPIRYFTTRLASVQSIFIGLLTFLPRSDVEIAISGLLFTDKYSKHPISDWYSSFIGNTSVSVIPKYPVSMGIFEGLASSRSNLDATFSI